MLGNLITSKTRLRLLIKFFINVANEGYLRGLAFEMGESTNSIRKELNNLTEAGYLIRNESNQKITYRANQQNPFFILLQKIVRKYIGLDTIVEMVVAKIGTLNRVFIIEDYAKGIDSGKIEVVLEGANFDELFIKELEQKIEKVIQKKVYLYTTVLHDDSGLLLFEQEAVTIF